MSTAEGIKQFLVEYADKKKWGTFAEIQSEFSEEASNARADYDVVRTCDNILQMYYNAINSQPYLHSKVWLKNRLQSSIDMLNGLKKIYRANFDEHREKAQELFSRARVRAATADGATAENTELLKCMEDVSGRLELREDVARLRGNIYSMHAKNLGQWYITNGYPQWAMKKRWTLDSTIGRKEFLDMFGVEAWSPSLVGYRTKGVWGTATDKQIQDSKMERWEDALDVCKIGNGRERNVKECEAIHNKEILAEGMLKRFSTYEKGYKTLAALNHPTAKYSATWLKETDRNKDSGDVTAFCENLGDDVEIFLKYYEEQQELNLQQLNRTYRRIFNKNGVCTNDNDWKYCRAAYGVDSDITKSDFTAKQWEYNDMGTNLIDGWMQETRSAVFTSTAFLDQCKSVLNENGDFQPDDSLFEGADVCGNLL